jgi:peptide-methionine (S)-S-oxide reductase
MGLFDRLNSHKTTMVSAEEALPGRDQEMRTATHHEVNGNPLAGPYPDGVELAYFAMGCFWGAERLFWKLPGVWVTAVGYMGGHTPNPTYEETCTSRTGHTETVLVAYDPALVSYGELLKTFWEEHDPTQSMGQGNDIGTQYRSAIYTTTDAQLDEAKLTRDAFQERLTAMGYGEITTEIAPGTAVGAFFFAEDYHQQYLHKVPNGYCGLRGTGASCPVGLG